MAAELNSTRRHDPSDHDCRGGVIGDRFDFAADAAAAERDMTAVFASVGVRRFHADGEVYDGETLRLTGPSAEAVCQNIELWLAADATDDSSDGIDDMVLLEFGPPSLTPADLGFERGPAATDRPSSAMEDDTNR